VHLAAFVGDACVGSVLRFENCWPHKIQRGGGRRAPFRAPIRDIFEIRGSPHRCKVSIAITRLGPEFAKVVQHRITDHRFEIDASFLAACTCFRAFLCTYISCAKKKEKPRESISSLTFFACAHVVRAVSRSKQPFFRYFLPRQDHFGRLVRVLLSNLPCHENDARLQLLSSNSLKETEELENAIKSSKDFFIICISRSKGTERNSIRF